MELLPVAQRGEVIFIVGQDDAWGGFFFGACRVGRRGFDVGVRWHFFHHGGLLHVSTVVVDELRVQDCKARGKGPELPHLDRERAWPLYSFRTSKIGDPHGGFQRSVISPPIIR